LLQALIAACAILWLSEVPARAQDATFEVASIKPNTSATDVMAILPPAGGRFTATNVSLGILTAVAYDVRGFQISELPGWAWSEKYDVVAKAEGNLTPAAFRSMMQQLLAERFQMRLHREQKQ
jgi:uncharacterized protein (TIGR03435 family)